MKEIRLHARFGQPIGALVKQIGDYALEKGYHVQAFNSFAPARPGAPTFGVVRVDQTEIKERSAPEVNADIVIVLDNSLLAVCNMLKGIKPQGIVLALGVGQEVLGQQEGLAFKPLDSYFSDNPADIGGNIVKALQDLGI